MAKITIDVPDAVVQAVLNSFAVVYSLPNGATKAQNAAYHIKQYIKDVHRQSATMTVEAQYKQNVEEAKDVALTQAETEAGGITVT